MALKQYAINNRKTTTQSLTEMTIGKVGED